MRIIGNILAISLFAASVSVPALAQDKPSISTVVATVDGTNITLGEVIALRERLPKQYKQIPDDVLFKGIVDQLIQQTVLMNAIRQHQSALVATSLINQERAFLASEMLKQISAKKIPESAIKAAYDKKFASAEPEKEFNASHILVKTKDEAAALVKQLRNGADFATLAKEKSIGPSGKSGGKLGWFGKGQMVKPFEDAVVAMKVGEISDPVQTQFGWHVIRLNETRNKAIPTLEQERAQLTKDLQVAARNAEIKRLTDAAKIEKPQVAIDPAVIRDVSLFDK